MRHADLIALQQASAFLRDPLGDNLRIETAVDLPHERVEFQPQLLLLNQRLALALVMIGRQKAG